MQTGDVVKMRGSQSGCPERARDSETCKRLIPLRESVLFIGTQFSNQERLGDLQVPLTADSVY